MPDVVLIQANSENDSQWRFIATVDIEASKSEESLPTFSIIAYTGVPMSASGFYHPVIVELSGVSTANPHIPIFLDHDSSKIIGQGSVDIGSAILVAGSVMGDDADSKKVLTLAKRGFKWQSSIGADVVRREFLAEGKKAVVNGRSVSGPLLIARETLLKEVSFTALGADSQTSAAIAASLSKGQKKMNFEAWLQAKGIDVTKLGDAVKTTLQAAYDAEQKTPPVATPVVVQAPAAPVATPVQAGGHSQMKQMFEANKLELARQEEIAGIAKRFLEQNPQQWEMIQAAAELAVGEKWEPVKLEVQLMRDVRPTTGGRAGYARNAERLNDKVLEAAVCMTTRLSNVEKQYDERTLEAADKMFRGGIGLRQLLEIAAKDNGHDNPSVRGGLESVLRKAFPAERDLRASSGFSTISLPNILSNVANKFITEAFMAVESEWRKIAYIRPVNDFKQITSHSLTGDLQYEKLGPGGEIKHGTIGEEVYTNKADTYAKMLAITRTDIINDDLGAFAQVPRRLGRGGALAINDVFWTAFLNNSTFFTSVRGNYSAGVGTNFDADSLNDAYILFTSQTDPDGKPLGAMPRILVVPPALRVAALKLMNSTSVAAADTTGTMNPWAGMFTVVSSQYLQNTAYTGSSATAYYLLADPNDMPTIEVCFLGGREQPTIETADADFDQLGVKMRGYHDFGVSLQEYRAGVKMNGVSE